MMIPKVRTWKVTEIATGRVIYIDTVNKRFARMIAASDYGMWGKAVKVSVVKPKEVFSKNFESYSFSQPIVMD